MFINQEFQKKIDAAINYSYLNDLDRSKACDLVSVMLSIFDGDISTSGNQENKEKRNISVVANVYNLKQWEKMKDKLIELVEWVSGDQFSITFEENKLQFGTFLLQLDKHRKQSVTLFSGGLDSLAGAYYNFENNILSDYVGYVNKNEEKKHQIKLRQFYNQVFSLTGSEVEVKDKYQKKKHFHFQSTRSLLYLSLAVSKALSNSIKEIRMYENGILSLNPEFGRYTTKTTHPKTIYLYNELLNGLDYGVKIINEFEYSTKGEVIDNMNYDFKQQIVNTFTCGKGRAGIKDVHTGQCGVCVPCVLRKISLAAYDNESFDAKYFIGYENTGVIPHNYLIEYKKNIGYFEAYVESIREDDIFGQISNNSPLFHKDRNYLIKQKKMFDRFVLEYERFIEKYGLH